MEYGGEVALDYSVMKNQVQVVGEMSRLSHSVLTNNNHKSEYSASAFKVVQPKASNNNNSEYG